MATYKHKKFLKSDQDKTSKSENTAWIPNLVEDNYLQLLRGLEFTAGRLTVTVEELLRREKKE